MTSTSTNQALYQEADSASDKTSVPNDSPAPSPRTSITSASEISDEDDDEYENLAQPLFDLITNHVAECQRSPEYPISSTDFPSFKTFWRSQFDHLRSCLVDSQENRLLITYPPLRVLEIAILDNAELPECPCDLDHRDADIVIRQSDGISREGLLGAINEALYGDGVQSEDLPLWTKYGGRLVVKGWNCMLQDENIFYKGSSNTRMRIWIHCAGADDQNIGSV
ncbi:MAG: hypothetical protein Q9191_002740 [Dirinaria sp. TL-2023a]